MEVAKWIGLPTLIMLSYGPPVLIIAYLLAWHWSFSANIVANNSKLSTIMETIQRDGVKCRHD